MKKNTVKIQKKPPTEEAYPAHQCMCCLKTFGTEKEALAHMYAQHHK